MRDKGKFLLEIFQVFDFFTLALAFFLAYFTKTALVPDIIRGLTSNQNYTLVFLIACICCQFTLRFTGNYLHLPDNWVSTIISRVTKAVFLGVLFAVLLLYLTHIADISRLLIALFTFYAILLLSIQKIALTYLYSRNVNSPYNVNKLLIIGSRDRSLDVIKTVKRHPASGYHIIGCLETDDNKELVGRKVSGSIKVIGTLSDFKEIILKESIDEIIFAIPLAKIENVHHHIFLAEETGTKIRVVPNFQIQQIKYYPERATIQIDQLLDLPTLTVSSTPPNEVGLFIKAILDYSGALIGLVILSPLLLLFASLIKVSSPGPIFFYQERCGLNGRHFKVIKFRTMHKHAEKERYALEQRNEMDGPAFKIKDDPRITRVGRFLRKTSLDELPQLINVLRGEMSIVGPRPPIPSEVEKYQLWQRRRLSMKPGITCIWQVSGRNDVSFEKWMNMDLEYIDNWSLLLDFKILLLTVREVVMGHGR